MFQSGLGLGSPCLYTTRKLADDGLILRSFHDGLGFRGCYAGTSESPGLGFAMCKG